MTQARSADATVETVSGKVRGVPTDRYVEFRGVQFGDDVSGEHRFRAARPPQPWSAVRDASSWPPAMPQPVEDYGAARGTERTAEEHLFHAMTELGYNEHQSEDGLYLNLWTPAPDEGRRPVMVWLHGGGFAMGAPTRAREHGGNLSANQDVVVVAPGHRLGPLGFLWLAGLSTEYDSNVGMTDIVLALEWVRDNIAAFGGDPDNVTVFGESSGSIKVQMLLAMPAARGLFHKAICQSGACSNFGPRVFPMTATDALARTERAIGALGLDATTLDRLTTISPAELDDAMTAAVGRGGLWIGPVVDGETLPLSPPEAVATGRAAEVPLIIGSSLHEARFHVRTGILPHGDEHLAAMAGDAGPDLVARYRATTDPADPLEVPQRFLADGAYRIPSIRFAEAKAAASPPVYMYQFAWENPVYPDIGAAHCMDTPFVFENTDAFEVTRPPSAARLAATVSATWAAFARTGDPNHPGLDVKWARYDTTDRVTMVFGDQIRCVDDPGSADRVAWERYSPR